MKPLVITSLALGAGAFAYWYFVMKPKSDAAALVAAQQAAKDAAAAANRAAMNAKVAVDKTSMPSAKQANLDPAEFNPGN